MVSNLNQKISTLSEKQCKMSNYEHCDYLVSLQMVTLEKVLNQGDFAIVSDHTELLYAPNFYVTLRGQNYCVDF